jgi:4-hydroxybenzoate polyprenyltransferase
MKVLPGARAQGQPGGLLAYLGCIRYRDVLVLQGSPLLGVAFSAAAPVTAEAVAATAVLLLASMLLVAHIWSFNDWAGIVEDLNDPNKAEDVFLVSGVSARGVLALSGTLLIASLALLALLSARIAALGACIAALGVVYSHPAINAKGTPLLSSAPHLVGGVLHFLLGYALFSPIDARGVLVALFFALTFAAGHLNQEVRDHEGDRTNGVTTNAVRFGPRRTFLAGLAVFTLAYGDLAALAWAGLVPASLGVLALALYPVHLVLSIRTLAGPLTFERVSRFQACYRLLYAAIGVAMLASLVAR